MGNLKRFLLVLTITPLLFVGCVSEKSSLLKPKLINKDANQTENNQTVLFNFLEEKKITSVIEDNTSKENKLLTSINSNETLLLDENQTLEEIQTFQDNQTFTEDQTFVENQEENNILLDEQLTVQALNIDENWEELAKEEEVLETAKEFLGTKYVWAANGPSAFDCSGFTRYVFNQIGINLPRHSSHQANIGEKIDYRNLKKGDLVFFDTEKKFTHRVNHVGIFIGDNKFIHASSARKKVIITSFEKKKFYKHKFLYARRVINTNKSVAFNFNR